MADENSQYFDGYCHDHKWCKSKINEMCKWKSDHEKIHREDADNMKQDYKDLQKKIDGQKTLLITALVALVLNLIASIGKFI